MQRAVKKIVTGSAQQDGAGVKLTRVLGHATVEDFDPFLMLDAFDSKNPEDYLKGFPWHPHRGIETVTYLIRGEIQHGDSLGNSGAILDGCCQWMTAGSGIIHQEMPQAAPHMLGVQLWLNLAAKDKMTAPKYKDIRAESVPKMEEPGAVVRVVSGSYKGAAGAASGDYVPMLFLDVALQENAEWSLSLPPEDTLFLYIVEGSLLLPYEDAVREIPEKTASLFGSGDFLSLKAGQSGARFLLFSAPPLKEPVAWGGPIVMNTGDELQTAFHELQTGSFLK
jgi:redox-sensitive bicupin YhaK (pirin superfamily)